MSHALYIFVRENIIPADVYVDPDETTSAREYPLDGNTRLEIGKQLTLTKLDRLCVCAEEISD